MTSQNTVPATQRGFTLLEVLIAIAITAAVMLSVSATFITTLRSHREVESLTESTEAGSRILNLIERDLRGLWIYNIKDNKILKGRNLDLNGQPADRIDFLTSTDSISTIQNVAEEQAHTSIAEVGYWLRSNPKDQLLMELWRREDPMVDDELLMDGRFQLVHDRLRSFNITYYKTLGNRGDENQIEEWDSSEKDELPRVIKIEFTIERKLASSNEVSHAEVEDFEDNNKKYTHYIVLEKEYMDILKPKVAMIPVFPTRPTAGGGKSGGGSGESGEGGGLKGPAGPGKRGGGGLKDPINIGEGGDRGGRGGARGGGRGGNRGGGNSGNPFGGGRMPNGFGPGGGQGNIDINRLFRQFGGGSSGGNPFGGGKR